MEQEQWIEMVLNSADEIVKVAPDNSLFYKIQNQITIENTISIKWFWAVAASFAVLFSINFKVVFSESKENNYKTEVIASSLSTNNQLY